MRLALARGASTVVAIDQNRKLTPLEVLLLITKPHLPLVHFICTVVFKLMFVCSKTLFLTSMMV